MASGVFRYASLLSADQQVLFHRDGKTATVSIVANEKLQTISIRTNGKADAQLVMGDVQLPDSDQPTMILLSAVGMALHPGARLAACIGFGSGLSTHVLLENPALQRVDTVEIEPQMVKAAEHFRPRNVLAYVDPRSRIIIDDAKTFFSTQRDEYDLIISEPSNPWVSGVAGLFSDEFYRLVRRHLAKDGVFVQWIQLYEIDVPLVVSVLKALESNFEDYVAYATLDGDMLIAAKEKGRLGTLDPR